MAMPDVSPSPSLAESGKASDFLVGAALFLVLFPNLLFSSPEFRAAPLAAFGLVALVLVRWIPPVPRLFRHPVMRLAAALVLVVQASALIGGLANGAKFLPALWSGIQGTAVIGGIACLVAVVSGRPAWSGRARALVFALLGVLVVSSLAGCLFFIDWHVAVGAREAQYDPRRLALIWPTRWLASAIGQEFWSHANSAAYLFAIGWVLLVDRLAARPRFAAAGWILATLAIAATFLTASRTGWMVLAAAVPLVALFRGKSFILKMAATLALGLALGYAGLEWKIERLRAAHATDHDRAVYDESAELHVGGLVERGSAGRLDHYQRHWDQLEGARLFGRGLAVGRTRISPIGHEHSSYLATLRCGGLVGLAAHLALVGLAVAAALQLARRGCRWPLLLGVAVFGGLVFDRSIVFRVTGFEEIPTHWLAVWIPLVMLATPAVPSGRVSASA